MKKQNKITSFWNMKPMKPMKTKPKVNSKPLFSPKFIQPVKLKLYPTRTKQEQKLIRKDPWGDKDRDRVPNYFDCRPLDRKLQGRNADNKEDYEDYNQEVRTKKPLSPRKSINELKGIKKQSTQVKKTGMFLEKEKVYWGEGWTPGGWRVPLKVYTKRYHDLIGKNIPSIVARSAAKARPSRYKEFIKLIETRDIKNPKDWGNKAGDYDYGMQSELIRLNKKQQEITALRKEGVPLKKDWLTPTDPRLENYRQLVSMGVPSKIAIQAKSKSITTQFIEGKLRLEDLERMFKEKGEQKWKNVAEKKRINYEKLKDLGFSSYEVQALSTRSIKNVDDIIANVKEKGIEKAKADITGLAEVIRDKQLISSKEYLSRPEVKEKRKEYQKTYRQTPEFKAYRKKYEETPEYKAYRKEYLKKYYKAKKNSLASLDTGTGDTGKGGLFKDKRAKIILGKDFPPVEKIISIKGKDIESEPVPIVENYQELKDTSIKKDFQDEILFQDEGYTLKEIPKKIKQKVKKEDIEGYKSKIETPKNYGDEDWIKIVDEVYAEDKIKKKREDLKEQFEEEPTEKREKKPKSLKQMYDDEGGFEGIPDKEDKYEKAFPGIAEKEDLVLPKSEGEDKSSEESIDIIPDETEKNK
jgi:hypothetical protein